MTETTETIPGPAAEPRRLTRSREDRWLGGVCAGLGQLLRPQPDRLPDRLRRARAGRRHRDPALRRGLARHPRRGRRGLDRRDGDQASTASGRGCWSGSACSRSARSSRCPRRASGRARGTSGSRPRSRGAAIVWWQVSTHSSRSPRLLRPTRPDSRRRRSPRRRSLLPVATGLLIGGLGLVGLLDATGAVHVDWRIVLAAAAIGLGVLVAVGALTGHARRRSRRARARRPRGARARVRRPRAALLGDRQRDRVIRRRPPRSTRATSTASATSASTCRTSASRSARTHVKATLGIGNLIVRVPQDVTVDVDGRASAGDVRLLGHEDNGTHVHEKVVRPGRSPRACSCSTHASASAS